METHVVTGDRIDPALARLLGEYLRPSDDGRGPRDELRDLGAKLQAHLLDDERRHGEVLALLHVQDERHQALGRRVEDLETATEVTGVNNRTELTAQFREARAELARRDTLEAERRKTWLVWGLGLFGTALVSLVGWFARHVAP